MKDNNTSKTTQEEPALKSGYGFCSGCGDVVAYGWPCPNCGCYN